MEKSYPFMEKVFGSDERNNESFPVKRESSGYVVFI
jgi:hypothetical protein